MLKKILAVLLMMLLCLSGCTPTVEDPSPTPGTPPAEETPSGGTGDDGGETQTPPPEETEKTLPDELRALVDFVVQVEEGRDPIVLQLTDTQIIDAAQMRTEDRLGASSQEYWATDKMEERCFTYIQETVEQTKPDLILLTGDLVYGEFDDTGSSFLKLVACMEELGVPWAPIFGNHEAESNMGIDWQCDQLENAEHCLFLQRTLTGNGNYTVGIAQGERLLRVFFMLDSNGCGKASEATMANGHSKKGIGFGADQIEWYTNAAHAIYNASPTTRLSFAFHIQTAAFAEVYAKYGFTNGGTAQNPIHVDFADNKAEGDFGYLGADLKNPWDTNGSVTQGMLDLGVDSFFVGHEHCNSASAVYNGVRYQFGQKSSTYDRFNSVTVENVIVGDYGEHGTPLVGGTVIPLAAGDGAIKDPYIYYCKNAGGEVDWDAVKEVLNAPRLTVGGLGLGDGLTCQSNMTMQAVDDEQAGVAYRITANGQGKVYIDAALLKNKSSVTFSVYLPSASTAQLGGYGEFALRVKPNDLEPSTDGKVDGYIDYATDTQNEALKLEFDKWMTFTVDISAFGEGCTELAFVIAQGNVLYIKDVTIA